MHSPPQSQPSKTPFLAYLGKPLLIFTITLVAAFVVTIVPWALARYGFAVILLWILPGLAWGQLIPTHYLDRFEHLTISLGLSFVVTPIAILLLSYLPGPLTATHILLGIVVLVGLPLAIFTLVQRKNQASDNDTSDGDPVMADSSTKPLWHRIWFWLMIVFIIAAGMRFINLDYSEFQGDEAIVMINAARILEGDDGVVFQHKKAPAEITVVMGNWRLTGITNEWMVRLPFAWISLLGLVGVYLFGRRLKSPAVGIIAMALLAIEGYLVAFARITQYQSIVFALTTLALLCLLVYYKKDHSALVLVAAMFFAGGLLTHYDAGLALPAGILLIMAKLWRDRQNIWRELAYVVSAGILGLILIGIFYIPFSQSSWVEYTSAYVGSRVGGTINNNIQQTFVLSTVYDSIYFLILVALAWLMTALVTWAKWGKIGLGIGFLFILASVTAMGWPELWIVGESTLAWLPFTILIMGALLAPKQSMGRRAVWVWFGFPFLFYIFLVSFPWTHVHTFFTPWTLLGALGLLEVWQWLKRRSHTTQLVAVGLGAGIYVLCAFYTVTMFVDHVPEYRRNFPEAQYSIYWTPYEQIPEAGLFGFPYRAGWKVVGSLRDSDQFAASYSSNEERHITNYYTRHAERRSCLTPEVYITAVNVQDESGIEWNQVESYYQPAVVVTVEGEPKLTIHRHDVTKESTKVRVEDYSRLFDQNTTPDKVAAITQETEFTAPEDYIPQDIVLGEFARLKGYTLNTEQAKPGGYIDLTLLWEVTDLPTGEYHIFNHLHDGAMMRGQLDGKPSCSARPTSGWHPGETIIDPHRIPIKIDSPTGTVPLRIGMYELETLQRLDVTTQDGTYVADNVYLTDVTILEP